jgi:hydroxymethylglutaryl-CoA lyase
MASIPPVLIECPRDALQGWKTWVPADQKIRYLQSLISVGFDALDCGSFVSHKRVPQMADTRQVLRALDKTGTATKLLVIVANLRGMEEAAAENSVDCIGYPFSISETFQQRNTGQGIMASLAVVGDLIRICSATGKQAVIYLSMAFGNPYGDPYDEKIAAGWVHQLTAIGVENISLADTIGMATPKAIGSLFARLLPAFQQVSFGAHLHSGPLLWREKIQAAVDNGCNRFDSAIGGVGGCPMAQDDLIGNIVTEKLVDFFRESKRHMNLDETAFHKALQIAREIFREPA